MKFILMLLILFSFSIMQYFLTGVSGQTFFIFSLIGLLVYNKKIYKGGNIMMLLISVLTIVFVGKVVLWLFE